ncbi:MAG: ribosome silencing factor [Desulfovibrionaceae bacterium]
MPSKKKKDFAKIDTPSKVAMVAEWLDEKKAEGVMALDMKGLNRISEAMVIATVTNVRHGQGLADYLLDKANDAKLEFFGMEGYRTGEWILLDMNDVIVHLFQRTSREFFNLEGLWSKAPVLLDRRSDSPDAAAGAAQEEDG